MTGKIQVLTVLAIILQYSLVLLIYYFLYRVVKVAAIDLTALIHNGSKQVFRQDVVAPNNRPNPPKLVVIDHGQSPLALAVYVIEETLSIGRGQHNDLVINDTFVSHEHACISSSKNHYLITDLNSTNGTLVNGRRIEEETALNEGDMVQIGAVTLKFER